MAHHTLKYQLLNTVTSTHIHKRLLICFLIGVMGSGIVKADDYYWIGGTGNWSDFSNHWVKTSGGASFHIAAPSPSDDVHFDVNSFSIAAQTVTIDVSTASCADMDWTGATNSPSLATSTSANNLKIYGSLTLITAMTFNFTGDIFFEATTTGHTITMASQVIPGSFNELKFNGAGGEWTLMDSLSAGSRYMDLVAGSLITNDQDISCKNFTSSNSNVRSLLLGKSNIRVTYFRFSLSNTTNLTFDAGTSTIMCSEFTGGVDFYGGGLSFHKVIFFEDGEIKSQSNTFDTLVFTPGKTYTLDDSQTQTITNHLDANGSCSSSIIIQSDAPGSQATISKASGSITIDYVSLKDMEALGGAIFTANNAIDLSNNTGWTINSPTPRNLYWVGNTGNWTDPAHWAISSGGAGGACVPNPGDNVYFDGPASIIT